VSLSYLPEKGSELAHPRLAILIIGVCSVVDPGNWPSPGSGTSRGAP
jgi:hypothetical protein